MKKKKNIRKKYARGNPVRGGLATREQETSKRKVKRPKPPVQDNRSVPTNDLPKLRTTEAPSPVQTAQAFQQAPVKGRDDVISIGGVGGGQGGPGENEPTPAPTPAPTAAPTAAPTPAPTAAPSTNLEIERKTETPVNVDEVTGDTTPYSTYQKDAALEAARKERIRETGLQTEAAARGEVPEGAKLPDAQQVGGIDPETGEPIVRDQVTTEMADTTKVTTEGARPVTDETVSTGDVTEGTVAEQVKADTYEATIVDQSPEVKAALGELSEGAKAKVTEISKLTDPATFASISQKVAEGAKAKDIEGVLSSGAFVTEGGVRASDVNVSETPDAEKKEREAITGIPATDGKAAEILGVVSYDAVKQRAVTGQSAKGAAASMVAEVGNIPQDIAAAIVEDPATVEAQVDTNPVEVNAAIAALPTEALVSSQMESLLGGMEDGKIPMWAKPAVDAINANMPGFLTAGYFFIKVFSNISAVTKLVRDRYKFKSQ